MTLSKNFFRKCTVLSTALVFSGIAAAAVVSSPFQATVPVIEQLVPSQTPGSGCAFRGLTTGIGTASYLGHVLLGANDCVNPIGNNEFQFRDGTLVFTAANGDMLFATYYGTLIPTGASNGGNPVYTIYGGRYAITGGTGRFVGATGSGLLTGTETLYLATGQAVGTLQADGIISLPADNQQGHQGQRGQRGQGGQRGQQG